MKPMDFVSIGGILVAYACIMVAAWYALKERVVKVEAAATAEKESYDRDCATKKQEDERTRREFEAHVQALRAEIQSQNAAHNTLWAAHNAHGVRLSVLEEIARSIRESMGSMDTKLGKMLDLAEKRHNN